MSNYADWHQALKKTEEKSDFEARQEAEDKEAKIARISSDPRPEYREPVKKDYPTTEMHYILCVDEENANLSMPEAEEIYGQPHKLGGLLLSDRLHVPLGWIKAPPKGTPFEAIKDDYPLVYEALVERNKKVTTF